MKDPNDLFLGAADGMFTEAAEAAGVVSFDRGRGAALADFNVDGLLDLIVANLRAPARLWRNVGAGSAEAPQPMGDWLAVRIEPAGPEPGRDRRGRRDPDAGRRRRGERSSSAAVTAAGNSAGRMSGSARPTTAEVRVTWPDGEVGPWLTAPANGFVEIERGATAVATLAADTSMTGGTR